MTAPTTSDDDDDLRYWRDHAAETVPVSELMKQVKATAEQDNAPLRIDASVAVMLGVVVGSASDAIGNEWPGSRGIATFGALACIFLILRWTKTR
jgi:hypothetical protein